MKKNTQILLISLLLLSLIVMTGSSLWALEKEVPPADEKLYQELRQSFFKLYRQEKYPQAVAVMEKCLKKFPRHLHACAWNLAVSYARVNKFKKGIKVLKRALKQGQWYNIWAFEGDYFAPYRKYKGFAEVMAMNNKLKEEAQKKSRYRIEVVLPDGYSTENKYPLFLALHGGGENLSEFKPRWQSPGLKKKFIVAYIQSSQVASMTGFHWQDPEITRSDLTSAYREIVSNYPVDKRTVLAGGFSSGGFASFIVVFGNILPVSGFVVLCPPVPQNITPAEIKQAKDRGVRGTLITSKMDRRIKSQKKLIDQFKAAGLQYQFSVTPDTGHWYPDDLAARIDQAILHIRQK